MNLEGIAAGTRLVTMSGDIVELIELSSDKQSAKVRYVEVLGGAEAKEGSDDTLYAEDIATLDDSTRFVGPGQTRSSSGG
jgi:hypothetical protein